MSKIELLQEPESDVSLVKPIYEEAYGLDGEKTKKLKIYGTAIVTDIPGINGRAYPKDILGPEVARFNEKFIDRGRGVAELNHPRLTSDGEGKDYSVFEINLMKACAVVEELYFEGNKLYCKMAVVENHPAGQALKALIDSGYVPGYSLRGAGSVVDSGKGYLEVADDYRLITIDVVGNPSFDDKALISSVYESVKGSSAQVLTEAVQATYSELALNHNIQQQVRVGRKEFNAAALESVLRNYGNEGLLG
jgi:hypothetical protein